MSALIVTGTDTSVGKTVVSAMLTLCLGGIYWKPIQSGTEDGTDRGRVAEMTGLPADRFVPERYVLKNPLSPHRAAELDGVVIEENKLQMPDEIPGARTLIIEGAGGLLVPLRHDLLLADIFAHWKAPAILCARTILGTINHSLLSLEGLRERGIPILGIVFVGDENEDNEATIAAIGKVKRLGRLPFLPKLNAETIRAAFAEHFDAADFEARHAG